MSRPFSSGSTPIQIVGTPAAMVTRSSSMSLAIAGGERSGPGITSLAPDATAACARPHAFAWNIGTTGRMTSLSCTPRPSATMRAHRVQERRAVRVDDALRVARGAARVGHRRGAVLVADVELDRLGRRAGPRSRGWADRRRGSAPRPCRRPSRRCGARSRTCRPAATAARAATGRRRSPRPRRGSRCR